MPAFSFEKLSPPVRRESAPPVAPVKPRSLINQMLDRLTTSRLRRSDHDGTAGRARAPGTPRRS
jgi:hypothetical protein